MRGILNRNRKFKLDYPKNNSVKIPTVFNHDIRLVLTSPVQGGEFYSGRALALSEPGDIVQMRPEMRTLWPSITRHYRNIGLKPSTNPLWNVSFEECKKHSLSDISLFIYADTREAESNETDWLEKADPQLVETVIWINSKNNLIRLARQLEIRVPFTTLFENKSLFSPDEITFPCLFKPSISVSGCGIKSCNDLRQLSKAVGNAPENFPFQIQEPIDTESFLNLQYMPVRGKAVRFAATEEILNGYVHAGSRFPAKDPPWEMVDPLAELLVGKGLKGLFAFDVAVHDSPAQKFSLLECNPRFNGASYPALIAEKLEIQNWSSEILYTDYRSLEDFAFDDLEFNPSTGTGIILVNWGTILTGKLEIMFAGPVKRQIALKNQLRERL